MHTIGSRATWILLNTLIAPILIATCPAFSQELAQEMTMTMGDYRFIPDTLEVSAGLPVRLTLINTDRITPHNFIMKYEDAGLNTDIDVSAGKSTIIEFTPTTPGSYIFYCSKKLPFMKSHRQKGMEGTLIVK